MRFKPGDIVEYGSARVPYAVLDIKYRDGEQKIKVWDHLNTEPRYGWYPAGWFDLAPDQEKAMSDLVERMMKG